MRAYILPSGCQSIDELRLIERPDPAAGPGQVLVRLHAASLNYRDQAIVAGKYARGPVSRDTIPLSDGAGEVVEAGAGVMRFKRGDRVAATFFQRSATADEAPLGSPLDGTLAEYIVLDENGAVDLPAGFSFEEGATLPCAAVTAWNALFGAGKPVKPGDTVLVMGSGGVSMFALQFAKAVGARVIATSSSDEKLEREKALGASYVINYKSKPEWEKEVLAATGGRGVDCIVEVGGAGTLARSFLSVAPGGKIGLIGVLTGRTGDTSPYPMMLKRGNLHGIYVGDRTAFERMNRAIETNLIRPIIDRVFPFQETQAAYRYHQSGQFMGKVVIAI